MIDHSPKLDTSTILGRSYDLLILRGLELLNHAIPIYLVSLIFVLLFLFALLFILTL